MTSLNESLTGFPTHQASVATALVAILLTAVVVCVKIFVGEAFPDGYEGWFILIGSLAGINVAGLGVKRFSDRGREAIKQGASIQDVAAAEQIQSTGTYPVPVPTVTKPLPQAGVAPKDPDVREAIQAYAAKQKTADDDPGII